MSKRPINTDFRRWCIKCNQPRPLKGAKIDLKRGTFTCAECARG